MIRNYNTKELLRGCGCVIAGIIGYGCAWLFFRHVTEYILGTRGIKASAGALRISTIGILLLVTISGYRLWKRGGGFQSYHESGLIISSTYPLAARMSRTITRTRVTGPAFVLTQLFLAGPVMTLRGIAHFRNRIPPDASLDHSLHGTLAMLQGLNKWQSLHEASRPRKNHPAARQNGQDRSSAAPRPLFGHIPTTIDSPNPPTTNQPTIILPHVFTQARHTSRHRHCLHRLWHHSDQERHRGRHPHAGNNLHLPAAVAFHHGPASCCNCPSLEP